MGCKIKTSRDMLSNKWLEAEKRGLRRGSIQTKDIFSKLQNAGQLRVKALNANSHFTLKNIWMPTVLEELSINNIRKLIAHDFWTQNVCYDFIPSHAMSTSGLGPIHHLFRNRVLFNAKIAQIRRFEYHQLGQVKNKSFLNNVIKLSDEDNKVFVSALWPPLQYSSLCTGVGVTLPLYRSLQEKGVAYLIHPITREKLSVRLYLISKEADVSAVGLFPSLIVDHMQLYDCKNQIHFARQSRKRLKPLDIKGFKDYDEIFIKKNFLEFHFPGPIFYDHSIGLNDVNDINPKNEINAEEFFPFPPLSTLLRKDLKNDRGKKNARKNQIAVDIFRCSFMNTKVNANTLSIEGNKLRILDQMLNSAKRCNSPTSSLSSCLQPLGCYDSYIWGKFQNLENISIPRSVAGMKNAKIQFDEFLLILNNYRLFGEYRQIETDEKLDISSYLLSTIFSESNLLERIYPNMAFLMKKCLQTFVVDPKGDIIKGKTTAIITGFLLEAESLIYILQSRYNKKYQKQSNNEEKLKGYLIVLHGSFDHKTLLVWKAMSNIQVTASTELSSDDILMKTWSYRGINVHLTRKGKGRLLKAEQESKIAELKRALEILDNCI